MICPAFKQSRNAGCVSPPYFNSTCNLNIIISFDKYHKNIMMLLCNTHVESRGENELFAIRIDETVALIFLRVKKKRSLV